MKDYFNYQENINVMTTKHGDKVISMNKEIYTLLLNHIFDASEYQEERNLKATAKDTMELWQVLRDKEYQ